LSLSADDAELVAVEVVVCPTEQGAATHKASVSTQANILEVLRFVLFAPNERDGIGRGFLSGVLAIANRKTSMNPTAPAPIKASITVAIVILQTSHVGRF
jgi:hypothetical protein